MDTFQLMTKTVSLAFILMIWSFMYKENKFFRLAEHSMISIATANALVVGIQSLTKTVTTDVTKGSYLTLLPVLVGFLLFTRFLPRYTWLDRYPLAILIGVGSALSVTGYVETYIVGQTVGTISALLTPSLDNVVIALLCFFGLTYFIYTLPKGVSQRKPIAYSQEIGRLTLMLLFGTLFGAAIFTRISHVASVMFVFFELETRNIAYVLLGISIVLVLYDYWKERKGR